MSNLLPLYEFTIDPKKKNAGVKAVSLVDEPAIQSDFVLFAKDPKMERYVFADQEKNMILGLALIPNKKIYRIDKNKNEFNGYFSAQTIEMIRNKFMEEKNTDQVNLQHNDSEYVKGVYLVETYIVNSPEQQKMLLAKGIDAPLGSWAVQYHVESPELFAEIKQGGYHGFSVEAFLDNQLVIQTPNKMSKFVEKFKAILEEFESQENFKDGRIAETGQQITYGKPGEPVKAVVDIKAGGNQSQSSLSDGQYTLEDGTIIAVKGGVLFEIEPKVETKTEYKVPTPEQIKEQHDAAQVQENQTLLMNKQNLEHDAANAYEPTGKPKEYKPVAPPAAQTMENDTTPTGVANNGDGLKVDPVKSIGQVPEKKKKGFKKLKTSRMKKLEDQKVTEVPATPVHSSEAKPSVPANVGPQAKITKVPATPTKLAKTEFQKLSRFERLKFILNLEKDSPSMPMPTEEPVKPEEGLALDPNASQPTDKMPEGKMPEAPVAPEAPKEPVNDATTKEVKGALPTDIVDEPETPEDKAAEGEEELPVTDMDKSVNELVMGKGDGQYNIMVVIENGVITEAGIEMEISQSLAFKADDKLQKENLELKTKLAEAEKKLVAPIAKPVFGAQPQKQNLSKEEIAKMTPYERLAMQKGFRVITAK